LSLAPLYDIRELLLTRRDLFGLGFLAINREGFHILTELIRGRQIKKWTDQKRGGNFASLLLGNR
jgi:hypothetical protein